MKSMLTRIIALVLVCSLFTAPVSAQVTTPTSPNRPIVDKSTLSPVERVDKVNLLSLEASETFTEVEEPKSANEPARYGGEEVCIVASGANEDEAMMLAERIRSKVAQGVVGTCVATQEGLSVTVSIGVATWREGESAGQLLKRADKALYQAKANGRNCVVHADACVG